MKKLAPLAAAAALALSLTACSGEIEKGGAEPAASSEATKESATTEQVETLQFGDKYTWTNGVSMAISKPKKFELSEVGKMVVTNEDANFVSFDVVVENGSEEDFDPVMIHFTASSDGEEAEAVFDTDNKLDGPPQTTIKPGKSAKFKIGFGVADPKDITMDASAGMEYSTQTFAN
ncbi:MULTISPECIES: DUF4352 domain-containing protein [Glutamicibacter]|uniref:Hypothetical secreted protein n=1 Tax=Glutamicibacter arilaitensis (strain DSM 16368 / CIP 108037 / IAM 15318 / JCM 13566 / NCIMB 14258 / Re117) TaxID=861360 RepID=A0ABP1U1X3_GLUAR|nr:MULTISPECIES: DUF4352 domain-containing protein [Glutamicibacter]CBT75432.1 hypothetical secreted protein [Glutamicibacter arilaitensis Re117]HCH47320.1 DUF4352 domain-containing protein [Glutamicibacter sp.]